jgi:hypothetical protein
METDLIIITQNGLRSMSKTLTALNQQVAQLSQIVQELRLKILKEVQNGN